MILDQENLQPERFRQKPPRQRAGTFYPRKHLARVFVREAANRIEVFVCDRKLLLTVAQRLDEIGVGVDFSNDGGKDPGGGAQWLVPRRCGGATQNNPGKTYSGIRELHQMVDAGPRATPRQ